MSHGELLLHLHPAVVELQHVLLRLQQYLCYFSLLFRGEPAVFCPVAARPDDNWSVRLWTMDVMRFQAAALACGAAVKAAGSEHGAVAAVLMHLHAAAAVHACEVMQTLGDVKWSAGVPGNPFWLTVRGRITVATASIQIQVASRLTQSRRPFGRCCGCVL